jgi:hypothetical protein
VPQLHIKEGVMKREQLLAITVGAFVFGGWLLVDDGR